MRLLPVLLVTSVWSHSLPTGNIILGYQNWGACDRNDTLTAVTSGVNVVVPVVSLEPSSQLADLSTRFSLSFSKKCWRNGGNI